jgi:hypothetical protein
MHLAVDLAQALDPARLGQHALGELDPWQADVLRSPASRVLLNVTRQGGKSSVAGVLAVHQLAYHPGSLVLLLSPSLRQSQELFRKCLTVYRTLAGTVPAEAETALRLELTNGSRLVSLPGKEETVRGYSGVTLLVIDEAARVADELYYSVRPMLAVSGGRLIALSTPFGKRGWWYHEWTEGEGWERVRVTAEQCPRIPARFLAEERAALGDWWYRQEYGCEFVETTGQLFSSESVLGALSADVVPLFGGG